MLRRTAVVGSVLAMLLGLLVVLSGTRPPAVAMAPASDLVKVCGNGTLLTGPSTAPAGAVTLAAGTDQADVPQYALKADTTYYFAPGVHTIGSTKFSQIEPQTGDTFVGAPGAVLTGQHLDGYAFTGHAKDVTVQYLTVQDFLGTPGEMVVNHTGGTSWTVTHDTIEHNGGAGVGMGSHNVVEDDCLYYNAEYGFSSFGTSVTMTLTDNEISYNDATGSYDHGTGTIQCGCSGGGKFWASKDVTVTDNYVHDNGNVGIWVDTDDRGFDITDNVITDNYAEGLIYEISYNAIIEHDTFVGNGIPTHYPAVYISESGGDSRVTSDYSGDLTVTDDTFTDNWGGAYLYENPTRYCGDAYDSYCTLITPSVYTFTSCRAHKTGAKPTQTPDYFDNCRWKIQNVNVSHDTFNITRTAVGHTCTKASYCGTNGLYSGWGTTPPWTGWSTATRVSNHQDDHFSDNTYTGTWEFWAYDQYLVFTWTQWTHGASNVMGTGDDFGAQDAGSTFAAAASPPTSATTTTAPPSTTTTTSAPPSTTTTTTGAPPSTTTTTTKPPPPSTTTTTTPPPTTTPPAVTTSPPTTTTAPPPTTTTTTAPPSTTTTTGPPGKTATSRPPAKRHGYDMVGADGGVFAFGGGRYFGSLPGLGVHPSSSIDGMVATADGGGYYLVGADGGVFGFGDARYLGSLPSLGVRPALPIVGMVATPSGNGYYLVGADGGVFGFGDARYLGSLPGDGVSVDDVVGIAATPSGDGYWVVTATGTVHAFGSARHYGTAKAAGSKVTGIAGSPTGAGYWIVTQDGAVYGEGAAQSFGTLPALHVSPVVPVVGIAHTQGTEGYWLFGADGGVFAFGDASFAGSVPADGIHVDDVVGAVPTT